MGHFAATLVMWSITAALGLPIGPYQPRVHLHGVFTNVQARDLAMAWRLSDPRPGPIVHNQYCSARVLLSNHLAFVIAGWTDAECTDTEWTDAECTDTEWTDAKCTDTEWTDAECTDTEWTDAECTDTEWTDAESTDTEPRANEPSVSLFVCMDHGKTHRVQMCLWGPASASERPEALHALRVWHKRLVGPHGPRLVIPHALRHMGDPGAQ